MRLVTPETIEKMIQKKVEEILACHPSSSKSKTLEGDGCGKSVSWPIKRDLEEIYLLSKHRLL